MVKSNISTIGMYVFSKMGLTSHSIANIMPCEIPLEGKKIMRLQKDFDPTVVSESLPVNNGRYLNSYLDICKKKSISNIEL